MDARPGGFRPTVVPTVASPTPGPSGPVPDTDSSNGDIAGDIDARLLQLDELPLAQHATLFAEIHERLTSALNATTGQAEPGQPSPQSRSR